MNNPQLAKWKITNSTYLVKDKFLHVRKDTCVTPEGGEVPTYFVLEYPDWANCLVIDKDHNVVLVNHYRHGVATYLPELVAGCVEAEDASPEVCMRRELEEEIGYVGGEIYRVGASYPNAASHTNKVFSFLAVGGSCAQEQRLEAGESLQILKLPAAEFFGLINQPGSATTFQSMHLATVFMAQNFIRHSDVEDLSGLRKFVD